MRDSFQSKKQNWLQLRNTLAEKQAASVSSMASEDLTFQIEEEKAGEREVVLLQNQLN